jgi:hypothetical protein
MPWFEELWNDQARVEDVKDRVLDYLLQVYADQSPQFVYYKTLFELFPSLHRRRAWRSTTALRQIRLPDTGIWKALFTFQRDGAKSAINKIKQYNGCILADSVGLGKTYTALAVIKYFELRNEQGARPLPEKASPQLDDLSPEQSLNPFDGDRFGFHVLHHTDLSRIPAIRTDSTSPNAQLGRLRPRGHRRVPQLPEQQARHPAPRRTRKTQPLPAPHGRHHCAGARTKVLLLSATPVNNQLADLRNQISFIAGGDVARDGVADGAFAEKLGIPRSRRRPARPDPFHPLGIRSVHPDSAQDSRSDRRHRRRFLQATRRPQSRPLPPADCHLLRGRNEKARRFPETAPPQGDSRVHRPEATGFSRSSNSTTRSAPPPGALPPHQFPRDKGTCPPKFKAAYQDKILGGFTQEGREKILISMMKVNFLKRLESSVDSFRLTLERTIKKIDDWKSASPAFEQHLDENPISTSILSLPTSRTPISTARTSPSAVAAASISAISSFPSGSRPCATTAPSSSSCWRKPSPSPPSRDGKLAELKDSSSPPRRKPDRQP